MVDPNTARQTGDPKAAAALALDQGAEILVMGTARSTRQNLPYGLDRDVSACGAVISAKIIYADTGEVLFTTKPVEGKGISFSSCAEAGRKALDDAGSKLISSDGQRFTSEVLARWALETQNGRVFRTVANGVTHEQFVALSKMVGGFRGHVAFVREDYDGQAAILNVRTKLTREAFRECLSKINLDSKTVHIDRCRGGVTELTLE